MGHVGFIGTSAMVYNTEGDAASFNGKKVVMDDENGIWSIAIQAGMFKGAAPFNYATNNIREQVSGIGFPLLNSDDAIVRFYRVRY